MVQHMKKILAIAIMTLGLAAAIFLVFPSCAKASPSLSSGSGSFASVEMETIPESGIQGNFLNEQSTGFRIYAKPADGFVFYKIGLFIDGSPVPIDERFYDASQNEYYLSSNTSDQAQIRTLIPEGIHEADFSYMLNPGDPYIEYEKIQIVADYTAPTGALSYAVESGKSILAIGDQLTFIFTPDIIPSDINEVSFGIAGSEFAGVQQSNGSWQYSLQITPGYSLPAGQEISVLATDMVGNVFKDVRQLGISIDGIAPVINLQNPINGARYASRSLSISYTISGEFEESKTIITLDGLRIDPKDLNLSSLSEGWHELAISVFDFAGNSSVLKCNFEIDLSPPHLISSNADELGTVNSGDDLTLSGQSEANANITTRLDGPSSSIVKNVIADASGYFTLTFSTNDFSAGSYDIYMNLSDDLGNALELKLCTITIVKVETSDESESVIEFAQSNTNTVLSDAPVVKKIVSTQAPSSESQEEEIARSGKTSSATDTRDVGPWYTFYLMVASLIVIAVAIFSASYYGYGLIVESRQGGRAMITSVDREAKKDSDVAEPKYQETADQESAGNGESNDDSKRQARW